MPSHSMSREAGRLNHPKYFLTSRNVWSELKYSACTHWKLILDTVLSLIVVSSGIDALYMWHHIHIITLNLALWYNKGLIHSFIPMAIAGIYSSRNMYHRECNCFITEKVWTVPPYIELASLHLLSVMEQVIAQFCKKNLACSQVVVHKKILQKIL